MVVDEYRHMLYMEFAYVPTKYATHQSTHENLEEYNRKHAQALGRPEYWEAPEFTYERPSRCSPPVTIKTKGKEKPYGPFSRAHWRYVWRAMKHAFLAEWYRQVGGGYSYHASDRFARITGITS